MWNNQKQQKIVFRYVSNHMPSKVWDEITHPSPNFYGAVWKWISSHFISYIMMDVITYPLLYQQRYICHMPSMQQTTNYSNDESPATHTHTYIYRYLCVCVCVTEPQCVERSHCRYRCLQTFPRPVILNHCPKHDAFCRNYVLESLDLWSFTNTYGITRVQPICIFILVLISLTRFLAVIQILIAMIRFLVIKSLQVYSHAMTARMSWHVSVIIRFHDIRNVWWGKQHGQIFFLD